jgi:hypothetical protein
MLLTLLACLLLAVVIDTAWVALFRQRPVGKFVVERDGSAIFRFRSSTGHFTILPKDRIFEYSTRTLKNRLPFEAIRGIRFHVSEETALLEEILMGWDLTDFLPRYTDTVQWFAISVLSRSGEEIPVYLSGQYQRREFLFTGYIDLQYAFFNLIGLRGDVEATSRLAMEKIRDKLGSPPLL